MTHPATPPPVTMAELSDPATIFDRAAVMPRPPRRRPGPVCGEGPGHHGPHHLHDEDTPTGELTLVQQEAVASIHPQLPPTGFWAYDGLVPGPAIEVRAGSRVEVLHHNAIVGTAPFTHVVVDEEAGGSMNDAGRAGASSSPEDVAEAQHVADLNAYTVVHLHGAPTGPDSDGWTDNVVGHGEDRRDDYEFPREDWAMTTATGTSTYRAGAAPTYWYHDHAMGVTRFNVYAGLAGAWLVRDPVEDEIGLPTDSEREIPLVLMDRGLDTVDGTATGALTGHLLHKVQAGVRECFAPVNLVNGLAWPRCVVRPRVHRLRIVCGANARTYRLHFMGTKSGDESTRTPLPPNAIQQIGTDGGLLGAAIDIPAAGLTLAPGERADVLVDFGAITELGLSHVVVYNSAPAPFQGSALGSPDDAWTGDADGFRVTPQVMRFDIAAGGPRPGIRGRSIAALPLDPAYRRLPTDHHDMPTGHGHTVVALREEETIVRDHMGMPVLDGAGKPVTEAMLHLHELVPEAEANASGCNMHTHLVEGVDLDGNLAQVPAGIAVDLPGQGRWVTVGKTFNDTSMTMVTQGSWHLWKIINLSPDTHPFHIHLTQFQATSRQSLRVAGGGATPSGSAELTFDQSTDVGLDANETGWKDTIRVNPGGRDADDNIVSAEVVTVLGCFARHAGQYVYHCHILEHEDREMMRPFTVTPADLAVFMDAHHH